MKKFYTIQYIILILFSFGVSAQTPLVDSLSTSYTLATEDTEKIDILNHLAFELLSINPEVAKDDVAIALEKARLIKYVQGEADGLNTLGGIQWALSDYSGSLKSYFMALSIFEKIEQQSGIIECYNNIGEVYKKLGEYENSLHFLIKAEKMIKNIGKGNNVSMISINIGEIYVLINKYDSAKLYFNQGLTASDKDRRAKAYAYSGLGDVSCTTGSYDSAIVYYTKSLQIRKGRGDQRGEASSYLSLADCYKTKGAFGMSIRYFDRAIRHTYLAGARDLRMQSYKKRSAMYKTAGNYSQALIDYQNYVNLKDSIFNEEKSKEIVKMQTAYESELLHKKSEASFVKIKQRNIIILTIIVLLILTSILAYALYRQRKTQIVVNRILEERNAEIQQQSQEIQSQSGKLRLLNENLESLNGSLEEKIKERTLLLNERNKLLAEYAYISAHQVRSPVACVLGLVNLLKYSDLEECEKEILRHLQKSTDELDQVISNIRAKLEAKSIQLIDE